MTASSNKPQTFSICDKVTRTCPRLYSHGSVHTHDKLEAVLNTNEKHLPVVNVDAEFALKGIMHMDARLDTDFVALSVPVGLVRDGDALPALWVYSSESSTDASNNTFCKNMWLITNRKLKGQ